MSTEPSPWWDHTRSAIASRILVELGEEHGVMPASMLVGTGLHRTDLDNPAMEVEAGQELAIVRNLLSRTGDVPGLGARAGSRYTLGALGIWGFTMITSPTVRDLAKLGTRYAALSFAFIRPVYEETADTGRVIYDPSDIPDDVCDFFVERELAKILALEPIIVGGRPGFHVDTRFDDERAAALQRIAPRREVRARQTEHALVFTSGLLDGPMPQGDPVTAQAMAAQCEELLEKRKQRRGLAAHVRALILAQLGNPPGMDEIARQMNTEERTLRRRLSADGTSYRELADEVRETIATELLSDGRLTVEEVAVRLGYHDAAAFSRAFKRWTGSRPGGYRPTRTAMQL